MKEQYHVTLPFVLYKLKSHEGECSSNIYHINSIYTHPSFLNFKDLPPSKDHYSTLKTRLKDPSHHKLFPQRLRQSQPKNKTPPNFSDAVVIREATPGITTSSVPFPGPGSVKFGGRGTEWFVS